MSAVDSAFTPLALPEAGTTARGRAVLLDPVAPRRARAAPRGFAPVKVEPSPTNAVPLEVEIPAATGWVLVDLGPIRYAVALDEVYAIVRAPEPRLLPPLASHRGDVALLDVRGRSVPVVDARSKRDGHGQVLLPVYRGHAGLIVDRVHAVSDDLVPEGDPAEGGASGLPCGVLRARDGSGGPLMVRGLPRIEDLGISID